MMVKKPIADANNYGKVKLSDTPDASLDANAGVAATPKSIIDSLKNTVNFATLKVGSDSDVDLYIQGLDRSGNSSYVSVVNVNVITNTISALPSTKNCTIVFFQSLTLTTSVFYIDRLGAIKTGYINGNSTRITWN